MESGLAPIDEVLEEINENTSDPDPSLPTEGKTSRKARRRASLFRRFLALFCCSATTMSMSRRCSIQIIGSGSSSPPSSDESSPKAQVGLINVISLSDELDLSSSGETISVQDKSSFQSAPSKGSDSIQADVSTPPQSYMLADELSFDEIFLEQDGRSIPSPASEESDSIQSEDLTSQGYVTSDELQDISDTDTTESEDSTSHGYVTADEILSETVPEQDRENTLSSASEESDTTESEDTTSPGYVTAEELTEGDTISEHDRRSMPSPVSEKSDFTQYEDSTSEINATANELAQDSFPQIPCFPQSPSSRTRPSIESTFPSCRTPTRLSFNI